MNETLDWLKGRVSGIEKRLGDFIEAINPRVRVLENQVEALERHKELQTRSRIEMDADGDRLWIKIVELQDANAKLLERVGVLERVVTMTPDQQNGWRKARALLGEFIP